MAYIYRCPPCHLVSEPLTGQQARRVRAQHRRTAHSAHRMMRPEGEEISSERGLPRSTRRKLIALAVLLALVVLWHRNG